MTEEMEKEQREEDSQKNKIQEKKVSQDHHTQNGHSGERRSIWASLMPLMDLFSGMKDAEQK